MSDTKIPHADSVEELARFWQTHDLTDFEDKLEEVTEPVFVRKEAVETTQKECSNDRAQEIERSI